MNSLAQQTKQFIVHRSVRQNVIRKLTNDKRNAQNRIIEVTSTKQEH